MTAAAAAKVSTAVATVSATAAAMTAATISFTALVVDCYRRRGRRHRHRRVIVTINAADAVASTIAVATFKVFCKTLKCFQSVWPVC